MTMRSTVTVILDIVHELPLALSAQQIADMAARQLTGAELLGQRDPKLSVQAKLVTAAIAVPGGTRTWAAAALGHLVAVTLQPRHGGRARRHTGHLDAIRDAGMSVTDSANREHRMSYDDIVQMIDMTAGGIYNRPPVEAK